MHEIKCPWCGPRAQIEFEYYTRGSVVDEQLGTETAAQALDRVFMRDDAIGFHEEIWQHVFGCRGWLRVERHNRTHEIRRVTPCRDASRADAS